MRDFPLPWRVGKDNGERIYSADGDIVGDCYEFSVAKRIVEAMNRLHEQPLLPFDIDDANGTNRGY